MSLKQLSIGQILCTMVALTLFIVGPMVQPVCAADDVAVEEEVNPLDLAAIQAEVADLDLTTVRTEVDACETCIEAVEPIQQFVASIAMEMYERKIAADANFSMTKQQIEDVIYSFLLNNDFKCIEDAMDGRNQAAADFRERLIKAEDDNEEDPASQV